MRTIIVCAATLIIVTLFVWLCCGFVSGYWNPMGWEPVGRFLFIVLSLCAGVPLALGAGCAYDESQRHGR